MRKDFTIHWATEAFDEPPEPDWVIEEMIWKPGVILWYGDSGSKKTYCQLHQGVCIATGAPWLDFTTKPTTVLVIDEENGEYTMQLRMHEIMRGLGLTKECKVPMAWICDAHFNYANDDDMDMLAKTIKKTKAGFVVSDSLVDLMRGGDENSSKDTHRILQGIRDVSRATGCVMSVIHHTNRQGGYRGSSNIKGEVDVMIEVKSGANSPNIDFESEKNRHGPKIEFAAVSQFGPNEFTLSLSGKSQRLSRVDLYILNRLKKAPGDLDMLSIGMPSGCDKNKLRNAVNKLISANRVIRINEGAQGAKAIYDLTPKKVLSFLSQD